MRQVPGDGRELVVAVPDAVTVRAEDGRRVEATDISPFISNLPFGALLSPCAMRSTQQHHCRGVAFPFFCGSHSPPLSYKRTSGNAGCWRPLAD